MRNRWCRSMGRNFSMPSSRFGCFLGSLESLSSVFNTLTRISLISARSLKVEKEHGRKRRT